MREQAIGRKLGSLAAVLLGITGTALAQGQPPAAAATQEAQILGPAMMLTQRAELGLSAEQVQRLEALAATQRQMWERLQPQAIQAVNDAAEAVTGDVDVERARAAYDRLSRVNAEMVAENLQAMSDARRALTPEQRGRWDRRNRERGGMWGWMRGMMGGWMWGDRGGMRGRR